jgi:hypothetical protein
MYCWNLNLLSVSNLLTGMVPRVASAYAVSIGMKTMKLFL